MIVLDTHVLLWWISDPEKLSLRVRQTIEKEIKAGELLVSSISIWEIYMLVGKKRLKLTMDTDKWVERVEQSGICQFIAVDNQIAAKSVTLPDLTLKDPADRIIIATALLIGARLVTLDERIQKYPHVSSIW